MSSKPQVRALPAFSDNYIWMLSTDQGHWLVDPGQAEPALQALAQSTLPLLGILITHGHADHVLGIADIVAVHPCPVYGPADTVAAVSRPWCLDREMQHDLPGLGCLITRPAPAHKRDHVLMYLPDHGMLFCGDTLFSIGCGRLMEGTPEELADALGWIAALPGDTRVYPAHEYTLANLRFARLFQPDDAALAAHETWCRQQRDALLPTLPTAVARERALNPYFQVHDARFQARARQITGDACVDGLATLAAIRRFKDGYTG